MTLDSPPGITRPSTAASSAGRRTSDDFGAESAKDRGVLAHVALEGEDADVHACALDVLRAIYQPRSARRCGAARSVTLMPTIASPSPRETSAMTLASS